MSPAASNCYITFLLNLKDQPFYAPLVAAYSVTETLNLYLKPEQKGQLKIKWINDVLINEKKICGSLCTCSNDSDGNIFLAIGIGVNLNESPHELGCSLVDIIES